MERKTQRETENPESGENHECENLWQRAKQNARDRLTYIANTHTIPICLGILTLGMFSLYGLDNFLSQKRHERALRQQPRSQIEKSLYQISNIDSNDEFPGMTLEEASNEVERARQEIERERYIKANPELLPRAKPNYLLPRAESKADSTNNLINTNPVPNKQEAPRPLIRETEEDKTFSSNRKKLKLFDDEFFTDYNYATQEDIEAYFKRKGSCLAGTGIESIIISASKKHKINPLILLTALQSEQSLIGKKYASKGALAYATGYGAYDHRKPIPSKGLHSQIHMAARTLRMHFDNYFEGISINLDYGQTKAYPTNAAAYALAKYTPHTRGFDLKKRVADSIRKEIKSSYN